jgi:hypothetical protein
MTNRRVDAIYFALIISVAVIGYLASDLWPDETVALDLPDFSPPRLELEVPFEMPFEIVRFESPPPPTLVLSGHMPTLLVEVRAALLESATPREVRLPREIRPSRNLASLQD